jgi:hypothetical protein
MMWLMMYWTDHQNTKLSSVVQKYLHAFVAPTLHFYVLAAAFTHTADLESSRVDGELLEENAVLCPVGSRSPSLELSSL